MTISGGTISFMSQFQVQCRAFLIPWVKNKGAITCMGNRDYSASVPVRYIPNKKSSQSNKLDCSEPTPMKVSKKKEFCEFSEASPLKNNNESSHGDGNAVKKSFNFEMKPQYQSPMLLSNLQFNDAEQDNSREEPEEIAEEDDAMEELEDVAEELSIHQQNNFSEPDIYLQPWANKTKQDAEKMAVKLLAARAFTAVELRKKLCGKKFSPKIVDAVVNDFKSRGLINDSLYAEAFCHSRWSSSSWGPGRIKQALSSKGVSKVDTDKAIHLVFEDGEKADGFMGSSYGMSKLSMDRLFVQASKQWLRGSDVPKETRKSRMIRWLQYRGFKWDVISFIVKKLESNNHPP